ncbi:beta-N-acetylhexosaminidase [Sphingobacterium paucimobilis]|uniref:N-acetyl-beta-hexosaminidase n=1 Tax=Sphingobacterium paucimobilis HER1398 TaxID=1346330 RepID=U2IZM4_9SPHI|nr:beta-N-acetylhexosaminidase [Sphingobacterium paucimobilis]ERJ58129.1 N-acetyl-beta-hexosaminidase [Sphingobacterium paucimobilis HER1398]
MRKYVIVAFVLVLIHLSSLQHLVAQEFAVRGFHLDLRVQVMKMPALKKFAKQLHDGGVNTLIMEWEATYPFENHHLIPNQFAYTRDEVKEFVQYCEDLGIDVIPLQQSFGHVEYILRHYRYKDLREDQKDYSQINPLREELAKELFTDLYKDMISTHQSDYIHIGGDETYLLGHSKESQAKVAAVGKGRLYGDYIKLLCDIVVSLGKRPVLWADIAMKYPDALEGLPEEAVFIDWNYGWDIDMFGKHSNLLNAGFEIWGAPSLRSHPDNYFLTQWEKHFKNIHDFVPLARQFGYKGMIMTSWSTSGLYGTAWESPKDIIELYPVRRVYPLAGFNILIEAYFESLKSDEALDITAFVSAYAANRYGFSSDESRRFWNALKANPYEINQGTISSQSVSVTTMKDSAEWVLKEFEALRPKQHKTEYAHYVLMSQIRWRYLKYMEIEMRLNAPDFNKDELPGMMKTLRELRRKNWNKEFEKLNRDWMYTAEIEQENELRNSKIQLLEARLDRLGKQ